MPSLNMPVQRLKVATLPLDVTCSGPVTHSGKASLKEAGQIFFKRRHGCEKGKAGVFPKYPTGVWVKAVCVCVCVCVCVSVCVCVCLCP
jgi:hypothetical protein